MAPSFQKPYGTYQYRFVGSSLSEKIKHWSKPTAENANENINEDEDEDDDDYDDEDDEDDENFQDDDKRWRRSGPINGILTRAAGSTLPPLVPVPSLHYTSPSSPARAKSRRTLLRWSRRRARRPRPLSWRTGTRALALSRNPSPARQTTPSNTVIRRCS